MLIQTVRGRLAGEFICRRIYKQAGGQVLEDVLHKEKTLSTREETKSHGNFMLELIVTVLAGLMAWSRVE